MFIYNLILQGNCKFSISSPSIMAPLIIDSLPQNYGMWCEYQPVRIPTELLDYNLYFQRNKDNFKVRKNMIISLFRLIASLYYERFAVPTLLYIDLLCTAGVYLKKHSNIEERKGYKRK